MTKSKTGKWDLEGEDSGTPGRGTRGRRNVGHGDAGTRRRRDGRKDVITSKVALTWILLIV